MTSGAAICIERILVGHYRQSAPITISSESAQDGSLRARSLKEGQ